MPFGEFTIAKRLSDPEDHSPGRPLGDSNAGPSSEIVAKIDPVTAKVLEMGETEASTCGDSEAL